MNDYESHLSSYDHSHKQRLKDMKAMVRDPNAAARARRQEARAEGVISIKLGDAAGAGAGGGGGGGTAAAAGGGGFRKGGFKKTGFKAAFVPVGAGGEEEEAKSKKVGDVKVEEVPGKEDTSAVRSELVESDTEDEGYEVYEPRFPTD